MEQPRSNKRVQHVLLTATLIAGLCFFCANPAAAQEDCTVLETIETKKACWVTKALSGEKNLTRADLKGANLTGANLTKADLTGAVVSRSTTKGVDIARRDSGAARGSH